MENETAAENKSAEIPANESLKNSFDAISGFLKKEDQAEFYKEIGVKPEGSEEGAENASEGEEGSAEEGAEEKESGTEGEKAEVKKPEEKEAAEEKPNRFGIKKPGKKEKSDIVVETPEQFLGLVKTKYGQDLKEIKDTPKFFESVDKWRADAQKLPEIETKYIQQTEFLESLPEDLFEMLVKYDKGEDYTSVITDKPKFDFKLPVDKQDTKDLVNHYFPGKFTDEDFAEETPSPALEIALSASKTNFNVEKQQRDTKSAEIAQNAQKTLEAQKASVNSSLTYLKTEVFPDLDKETFNEVKDVLEGGPQGVLSRFFNKDGTAKKDAAERLVMALYGKEQISELMDVAANQAKSEANEEFVSRGADRPEPKRKAASAEKLPEALQNQISELERVGKVNKKTY